MTLNFSAGLILHRMHLWNMMWTKELKEMTEKILHGGKAKCKLSKSKYNALEVYFSGHYHQEFIQSLEPWYMFVMLKT